MNDHLGSVGATVDPTGKLTSYSMYRPFGEKTAEMILAGSSDKFGYTGHELDRDIEQELYYCGARYYDPEYKIFTQVDPLASKYPSLGPYVYCANNPLKFVDPDGEKIEYAAGTPTQTEVETGKYDPRANNGKLDKNFKSTMDKSLKEIISTKPGNKLVSDLENKKDANGKDVMVYIVENKAGESFHATFSDGTKVVVIDPNAQLDANLLDVATGKVNKEPASITRRVAHELGHSTGTRDDGPGKMNNVTAHENPIMLILENKIRISY